MNTFNRKLSIKHVGPNSLFTIGYKKTSTLWLDTFLFMHNCTVHIKDHFFTAFFELFSSKSFSLSSSIKFSAASLTLLSLALSFFYSNNVFRTTILSCGIEIFLFPFFFLHWNKDLFWLHLKFTFCTCRPALISNLSWKARTNNKKLVDFWNCLYV